MSKMTGCIMKAFVWVVGIASLWYGIDYLMTDTSNWPQIEAVVTSSKEGMRDDYGNPSYTSYYEFEVDSVKYQASTNDRYDKGEKIMVYYDPNDPNTTVLSRGELGTPGCIGVAFGLFCIGSMALGLIKGRGKAEPPAADENTPS